MGLKWFAVGEERKGEIGVRHTHLVTSTDAMKASLILKLGSAIDYLRVRTWLSIEYIEVHRNGSEHVHNLKMSPNLFTLSHLFSSLWSRCLSRIIDQLLREDGSASALETFPKKWKSHDRWVEERSLALPTVC